MKTNSFAGVAAAVLFTANFVAAQPPDSHSLGPIFLAHRPHAQNRDRRDFPQSGPRGPGGPSKATRFGDPLPGLTAGELTAFAAGKDEFENIETADTGLGPIFNETSCVACHASPVTGGASETFVTRFGKVQNGVFDPLADEGGTLLQEFAIDPAVREVVPSDANVIAHRQTTPLFGLGLIETIPDRAILQNANCAKPDGIKGRASIVTDVTTGASRVGHFGWKGQNATLLAFAADAYRNEMGITSRFFPTENAPNGNAPLLALWDLFADPEDETDPVTGGGDIDASADFIRFLAPPPPLPQRQSAMMGRNIFQQVGCATCHTPVMQTGPSATAALAFRPVPLYSDLLLHDMGALGDGIEQGTARGTEIKTPPLWGLRASGPYLHDGRAATVDAAIRQHDGEATIPRNRYLQITPQQRQQLLDFLGTI